jgi:magnesium transporter
MGRKAGLPPGTLVHVGEKHMERTNIHRVRYDAEHIQEAQDITPEACFPIPPDAGVTWIRVCGLHQVEAVEAVGKALDLHPLLLEDILNTGQRPKAEDYGDTLFLVMKVHALDAQSGEIVTEQLSLVLAKDLVVTFQEKENGLLQPVLDRLRTGRARIRRLGADYLAYVILDAVVDRHLVVLEQVGEKLGGLEDELMKEPDNRTLQSIHHLRSELIYLRKSVWPLREAVSTLERNETGLINETTLIYLRDAYDHTARAIDTLETYRDVVAGMTEIYMSVISNRINEVMKVLTVFASIFIPLTFIVGIYGMNFEYFPEIHWRYGYYYLWVFMLSATGGMLYYFRRKKWL